MNDPAPHRDAGQETASADLPASADPSGGGGSDAARERWRARAQRVVSSYWCRFAVLDGFCLMITGLAAILTGQPPTAAPVVSASASAALLSCRFVHQLRIAHVVVLLAAFGVMLPVAIVTGNFEYWTLFGWLTFCGLAATVIYRIAVRNERRVWTVWINEPSGRDILLDARPFRCPRCDRVHQAVFARGEPAPILEFPPHFRVQGPGRRRGSSDRRVHLVARFVVGKGGQLTLTPAPDHFVPDPERCSAFAVRPEN